MRLWFRDCHNTKQSAVHNNRKKRDECIDIPIHAIKFIAYLRQDVS